MTKIQRNIILTSLVFLLIAPNIKSQPGYLELPIDSKTNKITYTNVVHVDSTLLKSDLFTLARIWYAETFRTSGSVIQMEDKQAGVLIGKANIPLAYKSLIGAHELQSVLFTFSLYFKDGRYKYEVTDFIYQQQSTSPLIEIKDIPFEYIYFKKDLGARKFNRKTTESFINQLDTQINAILNDLKSSMKEKNSPIDSDW